MIRGSGRRIRVVTANCLRSTSGNFNSSCKFIRTPLARQWRSVSASFPSEYCTKRTLPNYTSPHCNFSSQSDASKTDNSERRFRHVKQSNPKPKPSRNYNNNHHNRQNTPRHQPWHGTRTIIDSSRYPHPPNRPLTPYIRQSIRLHPNQLSKNNQNNDPTQKINSVGDNAFNLIFLGTGAGGQPCHTRTQSSTILRQAGKAMAFDVGEATQRQLSFSNLSVLEVRQIFITHLHADHVLGILALILQIQTSAKTSFHTEGRKTLRRADFKKQQQQNNHHLNGDEEGEHEENQGTEQSTEAKPLLEIYGPPGLYNYVAMNLKLTCSKITLPIAIYELTGCQFESGPPSRNHNNRDNTSSTKNPFDAASYPELQSPKLVHKTIPQNDDGTWTIQSHPIITQHMVDNAIEARSGNYKKIQRIKTSNNDDKPPISLKQSVLPNESHGRRSTVQLSIKAGEIKHVHGVQTFGYVVEEPPPQIPIDVQKAKALGVKPGPKYRLLKNGFPVESDDEKRVEEGRLVYPEEVRDDTKIVKGRKMVLLGDNCGGLSESMLNLCRDADVLVSEATMAGHNDRVAMRRGHSTPAMAGRLAKDINTKVLILNHISASNDRQSEINDLVNTAERHSRGTSQVVTAYDFMEFAVPKSGYNFKTSKSN